MSGPKGFFSRPGASDKKRRPRPIGIKDTGDYCDLCGLHEKCNSPKMGYTGLGKTGAFFLAMVPGMQEDNQGKQLVGDSGILLRQVLKRFDFNLDRDFWKQNVVNCRTWKVGDSGRKINRDPTPLEIRYCRPRYWKSLRDLQPSHIFLLGSMAVKSFFLDRSSPIASELSISRFRGLHIPDPKTKAWIHPVFHPSYILRNEDARHVFERDLKKGLLLLPRERPSFPNFEKCVETITDKNQILSILRNISEGKHEATAIDYETSGLKPQGDGHHIWSIGIGLELNKAISFPFSYPGVFNQQDQQEIKSALVQAFQKNNTNWIAHNIQMEERWNRWVLDTEFLGWKWCTMNAAHILDERPRFCSLDFQTFINWGFEYGGDIKSFKSGKPFNNMHKCPLPSLLKYGGLDALFTRKLYEKQKGAERKGYELTHKGIGAFCDMESTGFCVKGDYYQETEVKLKRRAKVLTKKLEESPEGRAFFRQEGRTIKLSSTKDLSILMYDILKLPVIKKTATGRSSVDAEVLGKTDNPFFQALVRLRKLGKLQGTYLQQFKRETVKGKIYPNINLHLTRTFRSSCDSPNTQNIPKHDKEAMRTIRDGMVPSPGNRIVAPDYGSMEVRIIAIRFDDPILKNEMTHGIDPHGMWAKALGLDKQKENFKEARYDAKNAFVFALFYGSYYKSIYEDLTSRGYKIKESRVQSCEKDFWGKYKVLDKNQNLLLQKYRRTGFVPMPWGHLRGGFLSKNQVINTYIQGPAFHCLLWSLVQINKMRRKEKWKTTIPYQVHDEILFDLYPPELKHVVENTTRIMTKDIRKANPWITIPLEAEWSATEVDGSWSTMKDYESIEDLW